jgi:hypothetical protein
LPPLRPRKRLKRRPTLDRGREYLDELVAVGADPPSVADEPDDAEQVALNHERMKPHGPVVGVDPAQHEGVLNGRATASCRACRSCCR